jgi:hypothetical protein
MSVLIEPVRQVPDTAAALRSQIKQELREKIQSALQCASQLPPERRLKLIRERLFTIQRDCQAIGKTFIVVEESITCNQYELGGHSQATATLFRGPSETASVAICVTTQGSLLHRNDSPWRTYRNAGDVDPIALIKG